jgi:DDE superfamily endonuclease
MPFITLKKKFLQELQNIISGLILIKVCLQDEDSNMQEEVTDYHQLLSLEDIYNDPMLYHTIILYNKLSKQRYIFRTKYRERPINKYTIDLNKYGMFKSGQPWLTEKEFITAYRMTRKAFFRLKYLIKDHPIFQQGKRGGTQCPIEQQLLTLLHYLSSRGSDGSGSRIRNHFHIAYGTKNLYINRCIIAIRSCMRSKYYSWPDVNERKQLAVDFKRHFDLPNGFMVVDGTTFRLMIRPRREDAPDYSGRKEGYTLTNLIFSDAKRRIRYYISGWAGCVHDNRIWTSSQLYRDPSIYFSPNEYLIGDSAFDNGPHMVTTYKAPTGGLLTGSKKRFNDKLSTPRVISEHVNGILKGRWPWLNCIPCILDENKKSMKNILKVIDVIVILHNFLIEENLTNDEKYFYEENEINMNDDNSLEPLDELNLGINNTTQTGLRREQLRAYLSEKGII